MQFLVRISELVHQIVGTSVVLKDPNDDPVVYTAIHGKADVLCTVDRDFYDPDVVASCQSWGMSVMNDVELLQKLRER